MSQSVLGKMNENPFLGLFFWFAVVGMLCTVALAYIIRLLHHSKYIRLSNVVTKFGGFFIVLFAIAAMAYGIYVLFYIYTNPIAP